jgi:hypothetical protein
MIELIASKDQSIDIGNLPIYTIETLFSQSNEAMLEIALNDLIKFIDNVQNIKDQFQTIIEKGETQAALDQFFILQSIINDSKAIYDNYLKISNIVLKDQERKTRDLVQSAYKEFQNDIKIKIILLKDTLSKSELLMPSESAISAPTMKAETSISAERPLPMRSTISFDLPEDFVHNTLWQLYDKKQLIFYSYELQGLEKQIMLAWLYKLNSDLVYPFPIKEADRITWENVIGYISPSSYQAEGTNDFDRQLTVESDPLTNKRDFGISQIIWSKFRVDYPASTNDFKKYYNDLHFALWRLYEMKLIFIYLANWKDISSRKMKSRRCLLITPNCFQALTEYYQISQNKTLEKITNKTFQSNIEILKEVYAEMTDDIQHNLLKQAE